MDDLLIDRRSVFRIGVVITAMSTMVFSMAVTGPIDGVGLWWLALALLGATGIGLLFRARFARVLGGLLMLGGVVLAPLSLIQLRSSRCFRMPLLAGATIPRNRQERR